MAWKIIRLLLDKGDKKKKLHLFRPQNCFTLKQTTNDCSPSGKLFIYIPSHFLNILTLPQLVSQPHNPFRLHSRNKMHTYCSCNSINLLLGFPLLCARVICKAITHSKLLHLCYYWNTPSSLPPPPSSLSSQAQCPNHLFPRHKSFPLPERNARIPPSIGKEIFKCNQRIFLCFIFSS